MARRIKKAKVKFISLCPRGANRLPTIYKADDGEERFDLQLLTKKGDLNEQGELLAVVYAPELKDSQGDIASAQVIKEMLYDAAKEGVEIDIRHDGKALTKDQVFVAEQFLVQKGDERFQGFKTYAGSEVDVTGAWAVVLKIDDPELRKLYREGKWGGVSMGGVAAFEPVTKESTAERVVDALAKRLGLTPVEEEDDMALTDKDLEKLAKAVGDAVKAALPAPATPATTPDNGPTGGAPAPAGAAPAAPVFKGDPTDLAAVKKHQAELKKHQLLTSVDWNDPVAVEKVMEELEKTAAETTPSGQEGQTTPATQDPAVAAAEAKLAKAQEELRALRGRSAQPAGSSTPAATAEPVSCFSYMTLSKEELEEAQAGAEMAKMANARR